MWTHLPSVEEKHWEAKFQNSFVFSLTDYGPNCEDKAQTLEWSDSSLEGLPIGAHIVTRSIAHTKGSKTSVHTIPQDRVEDEGGDTEKEINRFTSTPKTLAQPSSSALTRGLDRLNRLLDRVDQMFTVLTSHVQHITDQFAYVQG